MRRPIVALPVPNLVPGTPPTALPEITWIAPTELLVEDAYQRDLSPASLRLIQRIVEGWDWRRFKPPVVAWTDDGLEVIDGQHEAIREAALLAEDRRLNELHRLVEDSLPDLFGQPDENPAWCENPGARP